MKAVDSRRATWRIIARTEVETTQADEQQAKDAKEHVARVEPDLQKVCDGVLALMDKKLVPSEISGEFKLFYYMMKGDYYRYCAEIATGDAKSKAAEDALVANAEATKVQKTVEILQVRYIDKTVDVPVVRQCQVLNIETVQKTVEVPQALFPDRVVDVPVVMQRQTPQVEKSDIPVPRVMVETLEAVERMQNCTGGHAVDVPVCVIKMNLAKKCLEMLAEITELNDDHKKFYEQFVKCMKLEIAELLRFNTSEPGDEQISFKEYVDRMKERQNEIYYITGESIAVVSSSSFWENLRKKGYEVLYVADPVDEYALHHFKEFDGTKLKPTTKGGLDFGDHDERNKLEELKIEFKPWRKLMKEALGDKVEEVIANDRIVDSLCVLTMSEHGLSANMERIAQQPSGSQQ